MKLKFSFLFIRDFAMQRQGLLEVSEHISGNVNCTSSLKTLLFLFLSIFFLNFMSVSNLFIFIFSHYQYEVRMEFTLLPFRERLNLLSDGN